MNLPSLLLWGFLATVVLTGTLSASQGLGLTRMGIPFMLGTMFTTDRGRALIAGFATHFMNGWIFAAIYALAFESLDYASWWLGGLGGLVHGLFVLLTLMPLLPGLHPRMASETHGPTPTRLLQPPGFLALNYGRRTPIATLVAHAAYGAIIGGFYRLTM